MSISHKPVQRVGAVPRYHMGKDYIHYPTEFQIARPHAFLVQGVQLAEEGMVTNTTSDWHSGASSQSLSVQTGNFWTHDVCNKSKLIINTMLIRYKPT